MKALAALLAGVVVLGVVGFVITSRPDGNEDAAASATGGAPFIGSVPPAGIRLPAFSLQDERGRRVRDTDLAGKVSLVTFLDAQCTDACPVIGTILAGAIDRLGAEERAQVAAVGISTDPAEDTRAARHGYLRTHRATGRLRYLVGPLPQMTALWREFSILATAITGDDNLHSAPVRIYSRDGEWVTTLNPGSDLTVDALVHDIRIALSR